MKLLFSCLVFLIFANSAFAQNVNSKKKLNAQRTAASPKIDGILDDAVWNGVPIATDFIENKPVPGRIEPKEGRTEIKIIYDDFAIYVSARMFDKPDSVVR